MEATSFSKTSVKIYQTAQLHIPEVTTIHFLHTTPYGTDIPQTRPVGTLHLSLLTSSYPIQNISVAHKAAVFQLTPSPPHWFSVVTSSPNSHCWKTLPSRAVKTVTENT
jgi:hypothetical protein